MPKKVNSKRKADTGQDESISKKKVSKGIQDTIAGQQEPKQMDQYENGTHNFRKRSKTKRNLKEGVSINKNSNEEELNTNGGRQIIVRQESDTMNNNAVPDFMQNAGKENDCSEVSYEANVTDRQAETVGNGIDVSIRGGDESDFGTEDEDDEVDLHCQDDDMTDLENGSDEEISFHQPRNQDNGDDEADYETLDPKTRRLFDKLLNKKLSKADNQKKLEESSHAKEAGAGGMNGNRVQPRLIKSPSDTTLYTLAFPRPSIDGARWIGNKFMRDPRKVDIIEKISNFVESIRMEGQDKGDQQYEEVVSAQ